MLDLVTGGAGFIGSHLVDRLIEEGHRVRVLDNFVVGRRDNLKQHESNPRLEIVEADIADMRAVDAACAGVERIFHLAARADIVPSIQHPEAYFRANVDGTFAVLEAARRHAAKRFVYVASSSCYGIPTLYPTPETAPADCRYPYALTKYLGEQMVMHWAEVYHLPAVSVRFFNVYGPRARTSGTYGAVFGVFLAQLLAGQPLTIVGDGKQTRSFCYVDDLIEGLIRLMGSDSGFTGPVNLGSEGEFTIRHLMVSKVRGRFGTFSGSITVAEDPRYSSVEVNIDADSVDTRDSQRDASSAAGGTTPAAEPVGQEPRYRTSTQRRCNALSASATASSSMWPTQSAKNR